MITDQIHLSASEISDCATAAKYVGALNPSFKFHTAVDPEKLDLVKKCDSVKRVIICHDPLAGDYKAYSLILNSLYAMGFVILNGPDSYQASPSMIFDAVMGRRNHRICISSNVVDFNRMRIFDKNTLFVSTSLVAPKLLAHCMTAKGLEPRLTAAYHKAVLASRNIRSTLSGLYGHNGFIASSLPFTQDLVVLDEDEVMTEYTEYSSVSQLSLVYRHLNQ